jgi:hypothetical protein
MALWIDKTTSIQHYFKNKITKDQGIIRETSLTCKLGFIIHETSLTCKLGFIIHETSLTCKLGFKFDI